MELPLSPAAARRFGSPLQLRGPAAHSNLVADGGGVLSPAKKTGITDENSGISTLSPAKKAVLAAAPTALGPAAARLLNRTATLRATSSQQVLAVTSPDRTRPLAHWARPVRRPTPTVFVDPTEDDDAVAAATPVPAPTATAASVPPFLYDADGFVRGEDVDLTAVTEAERERLLKDAAAWCAEWAARMRSEPAKERRDRWAAALDVPKHRAELQLLARFKPGQYEADDGHLMSLYESSSEEALSTVRQDLPRTFPSHALFLATANPGPAVAASSEPGPGCRRRSLYHILASYASFDTAVGYCQGLSYVAATLLMHVDEEDAFWMLVALLRSPDHFPNFFDPSLTGLIAASQSFAELLRQAEPELASHMAQLGVNELMYVTAWIMRLFTGFQPWSAALRMFEFCLLKGYRGALQLALAVVTQAKERLMECTSINDLLPTLQQLSQDPTDIDRLLPLADTFASLVAGVTLNGAPAPQSTADPRSRRAASGAATTATPGPTGRVSRAAEARRASHLVDAATSPAAKSVWERLQRSLRTPAKAAVPAAAPEPAACTSDNSADSSDAPEDATLVWSPPPAAIASPEAAGPGRLARGATSSAAFREFATPTPVKHRGRPTLRRMDSSLAPRVELTPMTRARAAPPSPGSDGSEGTPTRRKRQRHA